MTQPVGEVKSGLLWKQEHLSPLPIPTGQPASDVLGMIWRKNAVYLDVGSISLAGGWVVCYLGTLIWVSSILYMLVHKIYLGAILFAIGALAMMGFLCESHRVLWRPFRLSQAATA